MRNNVQLNKVTEIIKDTIGSDFSNIEIIDIKVNTDVDFDGDDILRIEVVFKGSPKTVDTSQLSGMVRHIRPKLSDIGAEAFPILSFISDKDIKGTGLAPA